MDDALLGSLLLSPLAALMNTIVGFTVAHWVCDAGHKATGYLVSAADLILCFIAAGLAFRVYRRLSDADESQPELGRRRFMAKTGLALAAFAAVVVLAGTLAMLTLHPCD
jgi:MFS family permease